MDKDTTDRPTNDRTPPSRQRPWSVSRVAAVLLLIVVLGAGYAALGSFGPHPSTAAVAQSTDLASNPVVGVWRFVDDIGDPLGDNYGLFHADGGYVEVGVGATSLGQWRPTGENTIEVVNIADGLNFPGEEFVAGTQLSYTTLTYDAASDTLFGIYSPTLSDASGEVFISGAEYSVRGDRVSFETMFPAISPATPTP